MNILVTGGAGFIGSTFVRIVSEHLPTAKITILDALTYAGNLSTIEDVLANDNVKFFPGKIQDKTVVEGIIKAEGITHVVNFAAESHNDRSLLEAGSFIQTDVMGVYVLLEAVRDFKLHRMLHVSTDEVYGTIDEGHFTEESPIQPNTPYSSSKAGGEMQARSHFKAFGTPVIVTRGGNTYGPYQFPEKLVPLFTARLIEGKRVPLYGEGLQSREWIHVRDHAAGILTALLEGEVGEAYNVGDVNERTNQQTVALLLRETGRDEDFIKRIPDPRKGAHDKRYSMTATKLANLGWKPQENWEEQMKATVRWYQDHEDWWKPLMATPDFQTFMKKFYGASLGEEL